VSTPLLLTRGRLTALVIGVPASLALIAWGAFNVVALLSADSFQIHRSFAPTGNQASVSVDRGNLTLEEAAGDQVTLSGIARYGLVRPTIDVTTSGAGVSITVACSPLLVGECNVDLTVAVPAGIAVSATTDSGDITASDLDDLTLHADSGDLQVNGGSGLLHLSTDSGQITGVAMDASDVNASADSGGISLDFGRAPTDVSVQDDSGDVTVTVPSGGPAYAVTAHSNSGSTSVQVPTNPTSTHDISISVDSGNAVVDPRG
jgi:hypothetical protein